MPNSSFYAYFGHVLRCSKQVIQTKIYSKNVSKLSYFCKKPKNCFAFLFWDLHPKSQIFTPHPCPPHFENFSLNALNSEQKHSAKNRLTGSVKNWSTGRSTGDDFEIYRSGRVEKILTGSISEPEAIFFLRKKKKRVRKFTHITIGETHSLKIVVVEKLVMSQTKALPGFLIEIGPKLQITKQWRHQKFLKEELFVG